MLRALLTLCYTATALLGPGACCCSFQFSASAAEAPPVKRSCCSAGGDRGALPAPAPHDDKAPAGCPCKHAKAHRLPAHAPVETAADVVGKLQAFCPAPSGGAAATAAAPPVVGAMDASAAAGKLGGRALLTALHVLRC